MQQQVPFDSTLRGIESAPVGQQNLMHFGEAICPRDEWLVSGPPCKAVDDSHGQRNLETAVDLQRSGGWEAAGTESAREISDLQVRRAWPRFGRSLAEAPPLRKGKGRGKGNRSRSGKGKGSSALQQKAMQNPVSLGWLATVWDANGQSIDPIRSAAKSFSSTRRF